MRKVMQDDLLDDKKDHAKLKYSKHKAKLKPYKRSKYKDFKNYEDVQL